MVFGLFSRKSTLDDAPAPPTTAVLHTRLPTPTPSIASVTHPSPLRFSTVLRGALARTTTADSNHKESDRTTESVTDVDGGNNNINHILSYSHSPAPPPPATPSPPPPFVGTDETKVLYDLMLRIPPKTLHAYTLAHLSPQQPPLPSTSATLSSPSTNTLRLTHPETTTPRPPSPTTVGKLITFFSTLAPPPLLHCVRCHKDFYDVENEEKDKACRVPHDDESALVSRVTGGGGGYETLWGCCGQTVSGDGSEGPPDGWCYEGRHTTDFKRARFRADSTIHHDKLTSCLKLNCHGIRDRLPRVHASPSLKNAAAGTSSSARRSNPSPTRSLASTAAAARTARKRPRKSLKEASGSEDEDDAGSSVGRGAKAKDEGKARRGAREVEGEGMAVDAPPKSQGRPRPKPKPLSRPVSRVRPPASTSTTASLPKIGGSNGTMKTMSSTAAVVLVAKTRDATAMAPPKSTSRTLVSQSRTHAAAATSDSEASTRSRPRTRSCLREESRSRVNANTSTKTSKLAEESGRPRRGRKAAKVSVSSEEEETGGGDSEEEQESDEEERGRDRKRRRVRRG